MIALYINWNPVKKMIEIDAASPTSRNAIVGSSELQERISAAMVKVWKEIGGLPFVPPRVTDKGVTLAPSPGTWNMATAIAIRLLQRELGEEFTVGERPVA